MKARYFADDGKEFLTEEECLAYERDIALDKYVKDFQCGELKDRAPMPKGRGFHCHGL